MNSIQNVVAAIDFSEYSLPVLRQAADVCNAFSANLYMINVINQRDVDAVRFVEHMSYEQLNVKSFIEKQRKERNTNFYSLLNQTEMDSQKVIFVIKVGVPFEQLIKAVRENNADLMVMGPKGRGNLAGILFGTTAEKMFRHCPVSLLSVREDGAYDRSMMTQK